MLNTARRTGKSWGRAPIDAGPSPHSLAFTFGRAWRGALASIALGAAVAIATSSSGCGTQEDTRTLGPYTLAITETSKPALPNPQGGGVYESQVAIALPLIERPELPGDAFKPYPRPIWFTSSDLQVQLTYVITNLSDATITVELTVDGWNEFIRYTPKVALDDEGNVVADRACEDRLVDVPAHGRVTGVVSYDDFERIATALATIMGGAPNPFHAVEPHTRLREDPLTMGYVPAVIDGLTGFDLSVRVNAAQKIAVEATVEVLDHQSILVPQGTESKSGPPGTRYRPALPPPPK